MNVTTFAPTTFPTLRRGSTGNDVKVLQERLNQFGFKLVVDGIFGYLTEGAVKQFQQDRHLVVDGIVGSMTWNALMPPTAFPTLRRGSTGNDVKVLQERLNQFGFKLVVDGIFGYLTEGAVKQFQQDRHLVVDGIVGSMTWNALHR